MSGLTREIQTMPQDVARRLKENRLQSAYDARPPYQRNDYLAWISRAKRDATRQQRIDQMLGELRSGDVYMKMDWRGGRRSAGPS